MGTCRGLVPQAPAGLHKRGMLAKPLTGSCCAAGALMQSEPAGLSSPAAGLLQDLCQISRAGVVQVVVDMHWGHCRYWGHCHQRLVCCKTHAV